MSDDELIDELPRIKSLVIEGTGGCGKSMFMRYLYVALCEKPFGRVPLFVELRHLNALVTKDLLTYIYGSIILPGAKLTLQQFEDGLKAGAFSIVLDGFDEIDLDHRKSLEQQILNFRTKFPETILIVSSRPDPDNRFQSWTQFHVCRVQPMTQDQVIELIRNLDYDKATKVKFIKALKDGLYKSQKSFLSNPLLCIMMLLTFQQFGHIPDKMHVFYEHALDALFFRHDASKEGTFRRKTYCGIPEDEFRNCLSAFCMITYAKEKFAFKPSEL
jgi:predicted NACHT family NTPase